MAKTLFEKEYAITTLQTVTEVEVTDPTDSMLVLVPAPFLGIETVSYKMTSTGEIHTSYGPFNYIFTKPVVDREDFIEESLVKMVRSFKLPQDSISDLEKSLQNFLEYTKSQLKDQTQNG